MNGPAVRCECSWMRRATVIVITVAALSACGGEQDGDEAAQPSTSPTAVTTERPMTITPAAVAGRPPSKRDVAGTWTTVGEALLWRFTSNGEFAFDRGNLEAPHTRGTWKLKGRTITLTALGSGCLGEWKLRAGIAKGSDRLDDELEVVFLDEGCDRIAGTRLTLARLDR